MTAPALKATSGIGAMARPIRNCLGISQAELRRRHTTRFDDDAQARALLRWNRGPMTLDQVAAYLACSKQRVNMIERRALAKLKRALERRQYDESGPDDASTGREPKRSTSGLR